MDAFEKSILDGSAFRGPRTPSPTRSVSTASEPSSSRSPSPVAGEPSHQQPARTSGPQTGPKGVKADRDAANEAQRQRTKERLAQVNARLEKLVIKAGTWEEQEAMQREQARLREALADLEARAAGGDSSDELGGEGDSDLEEDGEAMRNYRAARMEELQMAAAKTSRARAAAGVVQADARSYVKIVDEAPAEMTVVVHVFSKLEQRCLQLQNVLEEIAREQPPAISKTQFLQVSAIGIGFGLPGREDKQDRHARHRFLASSSDSSSDDGDDDTPSAQRLKHLKREESVADVVPTLLIYRNGDLVGNLVRPDLIEADDWGRGNHADVVRLLRKYGALTGSSAGNTGMRGYADEADEDLDDSYD